MRDLTNIIKPKSAGFTLIEVMVSLVFVAFGLVTVLQVVTTYVGNISELEKRVLASWVASNHISQIRFEAETNKVKSGGDTERVKMGGYRWRSKATLTETDVDRVFLLEVEVTEEGDQLSRQPYVAYTTAVTENFQ